MRPPPARPFAIACAVILAVFVSLGIADTLRALPAFANPSHNPVALIVMFGLFLALGFSAVPVMVRVFFHLFFRMHEGRPLHPRVATLRENSERIMAVMIYAMWASGVIGTAIAAPVALRSWLGGG